jgi:3-hydroxyacyl-CoA dehydrogenase/enoyl-CoA hydratase/3-hydroxybutyryl-CoA epimerase
LLRVFHLQERLKSYGKTDGQAPVRHVHVVGAGVMGGDIAVWCALQGMRVTLQDQSMKQIAPVLARAAKLYRSKLKDRRREQAALDRLVPDLAGHGAARADLVIEAISENLEAKHPCTGSWKPACGRMRCWPPTHPACRWKPCVRACNGRSA